MSTPPLARFTLRFADAGMERRFREGFDAECLRAGRVMGVLAIALFFVFCAVLAIWAPQAAGEPVDFARMGLSAAALVSVGVGATWLRPARRAPQAAVAIFMSLFAVGLAFLFRELPPALAIHMFPVMAVHVLNINAIMRLRVVPAFSATCAATAGYFAAMVGWHVLPPGEMQWQAMWIAVVAPWSVTICWRLERASRLAFAAHEEAEHERGRSEGLLLNILPAPIAARLKDSHETIADHRDEVTVLFADLVGFTPLAAGRGPTQVVALLDRVFTEFDALAARHGLEKIKTIGDAYMAVAGLPHEQPDHAQRAARMALDMLDAVRAAAIETREPLQLRVGLHTGPVVAGVIGRTKFSYDLWGDTVNTASRMESSGVPGAVHCSSETARHLGGTFELRPRGRIDIKGKGEMETFLVAAA